MHKLLAMSRACVRREGTGTMKWPFSDVLKVRRTTENVVRKATGRRSSRQPEHLVPAVCTKC